MRLRVDDDIYRVDGVWLGPPQRTLPWRARYIAYAVGLGLFVLLQILERRIGIGINFWSLAYSLVATIALTRLALTVVDHDRTVWSVIAAFGHEVGAPRTDVEPRSQILAARRVRRRPELRGPRFWQFRERRRVRPVQATALTPAPTSRSAFVPAPDEHEVGVR